MNKPLRVLHVDENPHDREAVREALRSLGAVTVVEAADRASFEGRLREEPYDAVIAEFDLDGLAGLEVYEMVRNGGLQCPVILLTGSGSEELAAQAFKRGVADYLIKNGASIQKLPTILMEAVDRARQAKGGRTVEEVLRENDELRRRVQVCEAQIEAANKELESFAYSVSHDLRAPLRAMEGFARILLEDYSKGLEEEAKSYLEVITSSASTMHRLIDDLLAFSRLNRADLDRTDIDMEGLFRAVVSDFKRSDSARPVEVVIKDLPDAYGDVGLIRRAVVNLVGNAFKFTRDKEKAVITVEAKEEEQETVYSIKDNGVGFDMKYAGKLFGVFQRLHRPDEFEGTGVGLACVQRIMLRHGGRVWADAHAGDGATFFFTLPKKTAVR